MISTNRPPRALKLSICIPTFNRAQFIGGTLESILPQMTDDVELVILDGGSTDNTEQVVSEYLGPSHNLRYIKRQTNSGFDRDCDYLVEQASGEYCWLTSDDDLWKPGAAAAVLSALRRDFSLIIINVEHRNLDMSRLLQRSWLNLQSDRIYAPNEMDRLFVDVGERLWYFGGMVIKRSIWLTRSRREYYGSWFVFVAVIFQKHLPGDALVMAEPYISYRWSNTHTFSRNVLKVLWVEWPTLVYSLALSESAKRKGCDAEPWNSIQELLVWRGLGYYSLTEYRWIRPKINSTWGPLIPALVALLPGALVNAVLVFFYSTTGIPYHGWRKRDLMLQNLRNSRFYIRNWRVFKRWVDPVNSPAK